MFWLLWQNISQKYTQLCVLVTEGGDSDVGQRVLADVRNVISGCQILKTIPQNCSQVLGKESKVYRTAWEIKANAKWDSEVPEAGAGSTVHFPGTQRCLGTAAGTGNTQEVILQGEKSKNNKILENTFYKTETNPVFRCMPVLERKIVQKRFPCLHYTCLLLSIVTKKHASKGLFLLVKECFKLGDSFAQIRSLSTWPISSVLPSFCRTDLYLTLLQFTAYKSGNHCYS